MNFNILVKECMQEIIKQSGYEDWYRKPLVGFVAAENPEYDKLDKIMGHEMVKPIEILSSAQTVIVYFLPYSEELGKIIHGNQCIYQEWSDAYTITNQLLSEISDKIIELMKEYGFQAAGMHPTNHYDEDTLTAKWSHKSNAVLAGIGSFGLNRLLVTPLGTAGRLNSLVTSAYIKPTENTGHEYCLYYQNGTCKACLLKCPTGAISETGIDKFRCNAYLDGKNIHDSQQGCPMCSSGPCTYRGF